MEFVCLFIIVYCFVFRQQLFSLCKFTWRRRLSASSCLLLPLPPAPGVQLQPLLSDDHDFLNISWDYFGSHVFARTHNLRIKTSVVEKPQKKCYLSHWKILHRVEVCKRVLLVIFFPLVKKMRFSFVPSQVAEYL